MLATTKLTAGIRGVPGVLLMETVTMISTAPDHSPAGAFLPPPPPHLLTIIIMIIMILTGEHGLAMISIVTTEEDSEDRTIRLC